MKVCSNQPRDDNNCRYNVVAKKFKLLQIASPCLLLAGEGTLTCANERQGQLCEALQTTYIMLLFNFAQTVGFVKVVRWICRKLLHVFLQVVTWICKN